MLYFNGLRPMNFYYKDQRVKHKKSPVAAGGGGLYKESYSVFRLLLHIFIFFFVGLIFNEWDEEVWLLSKESLRLDERNVFVLC